GPPVLVLPRLREPIRRKRSVSGRRLQIAVPEIVRQRLSVVPIVGELVSGRVSKHVRMDLKGKPRCLAGTLNHSQEPRWRYRSGSFGREHVSALTLQGA